MIMILLLIVSTTVVAGALSQQSTACKQAYQDMAKATNARNNAEREVQRANGRLEHARDMLEICLGMHKNGRRV